MLINGSFQQQSKRLTPGSVVALSKKEDQFKKRVKIATVAQRDFKEGQDPVVDLMWADPSDAILDPREEYLMIESRTGYYEAARHVLTSLQQGSAEKPLSLDRYLLNGGPQPDNSSHSLDADLPLDPSQQKAVCTMLHNPLALVQGPPGTGKTFTSVQALREMRKNPGQPILVSAQTNQALDSLLALYKPYGPILRVGGRTQHEDLQSDTIYNFRNRIGAKSDAEYKSLAKKKIEMIKCIQELIETVFGGDQMLDPQALLKEGIITEQQFSSLHDPDTSIDEDGFILWLGSDRIPAELNPLGIGPTDDIDARWASAKKFFEVEDEEPFAQDEEDSRSISGPEIPLKWNWCGKDPPLAGPYKRHMRRLLLDCQDL